MSADDVIKGEFKCPRCGAVLKEKRPLKDRLLLRHKERTVRLYCPCGYLRDEVVRPEDFHDRDPE